uniref:Frag1/DRAM/Sfk1 family-domain-containing protein n=1 Tax=Panagrellus redivivus TaxID=6233 RepID=A0A7E5A1T9_PANRE
MAKPSTSSIVTMVSEPATSEIACKPDYRISIRTLCLLGALLPGFGCYACIAYTYLFQLDKVLNFVSSHCPNVKSPFPPVSYSIGVWEPQRFFWLLILCIHLPPRLFFAVIYTRQYRLGKSEHQKSVWFRRVMYAHMRFLILEPLGLVCVSVIDIDSHFLIHAICYSVWIISFNFNMLLNTILHHYSGYRTLHDNHDCTFQIKRLMFIIGCPLAISTGVSYLTYVYYCINFSYAAFSVAEYIIVGFNSMFYFLIVWEMGDSHIDMTLGNLGKALQDA